jgi:hypothetical protein
VGKNIDFYVPFITGFVPSEGYHYNDAELEIIAEHKEWRRGTHYGDPAGRFRNQVSDETVFSVLKSNGIIINFRENWKEFAIRKRVTKSLLMGGINMNLNKRTEYFDICMINASYPKVRNEGTLLVRSDKPKHDSTSHYRSALEYLALGIEDRSEIYRRVHDQFPKKPNRGRATSY